MNRFAAAALACAATAAVLMLGTSPAHAAADDLVVEVIGGGALFDTDDLRPGYETSSMLSVRNASGEAGTVALRIVDLTSDDNGCNRPEAAVDATCGEDEGELDEQAVLDVARRIGPAHFETVIAPTLLSDLDDAVLFDHDLAANSVLVYRLTLTLPASSGNETQTDSIDFDLEVHGRSLVIGGTSVRSGATTPPATGGNGPTPPPVVEDEREDPDEGDAGGPPAVSRPGTEVLGDGARSLRSPSETGGTLPLTGSGLMEIWAAGMALLLIGATAFALNGPLRARFAARR